MVLTFVEEQCGAFRENLWNLMATPNVIPLSIVLSSEVHGSMGMSYIIGVVVVIIIVAGFFGLHV